MDPSSALLHQEMCSNSLESMLLCSKAQQQQERKPRPQQEEALKCPRCESINTKFCYYNNYSLSQPRYFCKSCRRYWTKGGTLRNVPVGGGCRKNKRSSSSTKRTAHDPTLINPLSSLSSLSYDDSTDLSLAFARLQRQSSGQLLGLDSFLGAPNCGIITQPPAFLDATTHNSYFGYGNGSMGEIPYEEMSGISSSASMKQEYCNGKDSESKVLWGYPWQLNGDANIGDNRFTPSWHNGLLNAPLM